MGMRQQRWNIAKIRRRHKAYRNLLLLELVIIWLIPLSQRFPLIIDLSAIALELFFLNLVVHLSLLSSGRRLVFALGGCSLLVELVWIVSRHAGDVVALPVPLLGSLALLRFALVVHFFWAGPGATGSCLDSRAVRHHLGLDGGCGWLRADWFGGWGVAQHLVSAGSGGVWGAALPA